MIEQFLFKRLSRSDLILALLNAAIDVAHWDSSSPDYQLGSDEVVLVYGISAIPRSRPCAIIVSDNYLNDFFVWLETYAAQFFPITQVCRVFCQKDWRSYFTAQKQLIAGEYARIFAGLIVGETMAQNGGDPIKSLEASNLSSLQSTFSFAYARSRLLWGDSEEFGMSLSHSFDLLKSLGVMPSRRLELSTMRTVWSVTRGATSFRESGATGAIAQSIDDLRVNRGLSNNAILGLARYFESARELLALELRSAEERVHVLDKLLEFTGQGSDHERLLVETFCAAYATVEIGGGTTRHMSLLCELGERQPIVWLWFGLIASIGEGDKWHATFARLGRLMERELSYSLDLQDSPRSDVSLRELAAYAYNRKVDWLIEVPRAQSRSVSVELMPGVSIQVPIAANALNDKLGSRDEREAPKIDTTLLDEAMATLWAFREKLLAGRNIYQESEPLKKSKKRGTRGAKIKNDRLL